MGGVWRLGLVDGNLPPGFTNLGIIGQEAADFGKPALVHAHMVIPTTRPPWFGAGLSRIGHSLTLTAGVYPSCFTAAGVSALFDAIDDQIPSP